MENKTQLVLTMAAADGEKSTLYCRYYSGRS